MKNLFVLSVILLCLETSYSQSIKWNDNLRVSEEVKFLKADSVNENFNLFLSRRIIIDSLNEYSGTKRSAYKDRTYLAEFSKPAKISQLLIHSQKSVFGLIIYIKAYEKNGKQHLLYDHSSGKLCSGEGEQVLLLNIPPTFYEVSKVEIGALINDNFINKIGFSNEADGNKIISELALQEYKNICIKTSFIAEKENLGVAINSLSNEVKPVISPDGKTLMFCRQNYTNNIGGKRDAQDILLFYYQR